MRVPVFGLVGDDDLDVSFGAKGTAVNEGGAGLDAAFVYVASCLNIIQSI